MTYNDRKEVPVEFTWDFTPIYSSDEAFEEEYKVAEKLVNEIPAIEGTLSKSAEALKHGLDVVYGAAEKVEKLYIYAMLRLNTDNGNATYQAMQGRAMNLYVTMATLGAFLSPEILAMDKKTLDAYMSEEILADYRHQIEDTDRARPYTKSAEIEKVLAMMADAAQAPDNAFTMFESVDMKFPKTLGESGKKEPLTHGNFGGFRESADREVRKKAFVTYFGEFRKYNNTLAALYTGNVKQDNFRSKVRGYKSSCDAAMFADNASTKVYDSLIKAVHGAFPTMKKYSELRRKALGLDKLHMYDLYCPMVADVDMSVTFDEAKDLVRNATAPLGKEYRALLERAFSERWIDVYENKGKTTGAYSCGVHGVHPYVLLNFAGKLDDAFTLAHELGHAMHSYFSSDKNSFVNKEYAIMVAEVASTVNEVLLTKYLLKTEKDEKRRASILNHYLEGFRTTVFRQTLFAEFERKAHDADAKGEPLTAEYLNKLYRGLCGKYYGGVVNDKYNDIEWSRIPHFYNAFYVYKYATGFCSAVKIANRILNENGAADYLKFLSTGGSMYPLDELKITGVDLTKPETVSDALKEFDASIDELEKILLK